MNMYDIQTIGCQSAALTRPMVRTDLASSLGLEARPAGQWNGHIHHAARGMIATPHRYGNYLGRVREHVGMLAKLVQALRVFNHEAERLADLSLC